MPCQLAIATMSLGRASCHSFTHKLDQAKRNGYTGLEIFYEDLETMASLMPGGATPSNQQKAAAEITRLCSARNIEIICLQPFMHYEGLVDRTLHAQRLDDLKHWFTLATILNTDLIAMPSTFLPPTETTADIPTIVSDFTEAALLAASHDPPLRLCYESLAWATHTDTWEKSWDIVRRVNLPNFGICLDTFNIAGRIYADPASASGRTLNADVAVEESLERMVGTVDVKKVFFIQVVDAERLSAPLVEGHEFFVPGQPARMSWSRNCRLFYGEEEYGAYLPVRQILDAIFNGLGYEGWVSMELFNRLMGDEREEVPGILARRGRIGWERLVKDFPGVVVGEVEVEKVPAIVRQDSVQSIVM
ncbi:xylose isomerase-like protein [Aulographum hederae CBS 113979]|uniref:Xylose isomerase-like protein n=1 Tax=Aulographum hederae CBS 113979 TaxID=1176131 RepID=A0A6G1H1U2_9PEZI|nr:xylose isomerase-like protein [Aulographum hederae CBS 113979]